MAANATYGLAGMSESFPPGFNPAGDLHAPELQLDVPQFRGMQPPAPHPTAAPVSGGGLPATPFDGLFAQAETQYGLPPGMLKSMANVESRFNPNATSPKGARGIMQFMPQTAARFGIAGRETDPAASIDAAGKYMQAHMNMFGGDIVKAIAAYNAGEGNVQRSGGIPNNPETQAYVPKVLAGFDNPLRGGGPSVSAPAPVVSTDDTSRGFTNAFMQVPQLLYGLESGAGAVGEHLFGEGGIASGIKAHGMAGYKEWGDKVAGNTRDTDSWTTAYDRASTGDFGALVDWFQHGIGYAAGQGVQILATGGLGALAAKGAGVGASKLAAGMVAKESARLAGTEAGAALSAEQLGKVATANVAAKIGANTAIAANALGSEGGEIYGDLVTSASQQGRQLTGAELGKAFVATLGAGGLEFVGDRLGLDLMMGKILPGASRVARAGAAGAAGLVGEGGTEYSQTLAEEWGKGNDPFSTESMRGAKDAAALGALGGGMMGGIGGGLHKGQTPPALIPPPAQLETSPPVDALDPVAFMAQQNALREANAPFVQEQNFRAGLGRMASANDAAIGAADINPVTGQPHTATPGQSYDLFSFNPRDALHNPQASREPVAPPPNRRQMELNLAPTNPDILYGTDAAVSAGKTFNQMPITDDIRPGTIPGVGEAPVQEAPTWQAQVKSAFTQAKSKATKTMNTITAMETPDAAAAVIRDKYSATGDRAPMKNTMVALNAAHTALTGVDVETYDKQQGGQNAVQVESPSQGVPRSQGPQVGLQKVGAGNAQPQVVTGQGKTQGQEKVVPPAAQALTKENRNGATTGIQTLPQEGRNAEGQTNQGTREGRVGQGEKSGVRKAQEKGQVLTAQQRKNNPLDRLPPARKKQILDMLNDVMGWNEEGRFDGTKETMSYAEVGKKWGISKQAVQQALAEVKDKNGKGLTAAKIKILQAQGAASDTIDLDELMPSQGESVRETGEDTESGTGFTIVDNPDESHIHEAPMKGMNDEERRIALQNVKDTKKTDAAVSAGETETDKRKAAKMEAEANNLADRQALGNAEGKSSEPTAGDVAKWVELLTGIAAKKAEHLWNQLANLASGDVAPLFEQIPINFAASWVSETEELRESMRDNAKGWAKFTADVDTLFDSYNEELPHGNRDIPTIKQVGEGSRISTVPDAQKRTGIVQEAGPRDEGTAGDNQQVQGSPLTRRIAALRDTIGPEGVKQLDALLVSYAAKDITFAQMKSKLDGLESKQFSKQKSETESDEGTTKEAVESVVFGLTGGPENMKVHVFQTADDAVTAGKLSSMDADGTQAWVEKGHAFFILSAIKPGTEMAVFLHEVGVHLGLEEMLTTEQLGKLHNQILAWDKSGVGEAGKIAKAAMARVANASTATDDVTKQELLAYFVEEAVKSGIDPTATHSHTAIGRFFRTLWAAFKVAIRKLNINPEKLTAQNVVDLAYGAARLELNGTWHGTASEHRVFNHKFMGTGEGAQAFGWGTYLAQRSGIGKEYWSADVKRKAPKIPARSLSMYLRSVELTHALTMDDLLGFDNRGEAMSAIMQHSDWDTRWDVSPELAKEGAAWKAWVNKGKKEEAPKGSLMRTDTNVRDDELLDWDKPLREQSDLVKAVLAEHYPITQYENWQAEATGADFYIDEVSHLKDTNFPNAERSVSMDLDHYGIKGIKFLDNPSRKAISEVIRPDGTKLDIPTGRGYSYEVSDALHFVNGFASLADAVAEATRQGEMYPAMATAAKIIQRWEDRGYTLRQPAVTRNLVIFNDKNIHRVYSEVGADRQKLRFSKFADKAPLPGRTAFMDKMHDFAIDLIGDKGKAWGMNFMTMRDLKDTFGKRLPSLAKYVDTMLTMGADSHATALEYAKVQETILSLGSKETQGKLLDIMTESTQLGIHPDKALNDPMNKHVTDKVAYARLHAKWEALGHSADGKKAQAAYDAARKLFHDNWKKRIDLLTKKVESLGMDAKELAKWKATQAAWAKKMQGPYFPLTRFGEWVSVWKSQALVDAENANDKKVTDELKQSASHYKVAFMDSMTASKRLAAQWGEAGGKSYSQKRVEFATTSSTVDKVFLDKIESQLTLTLGTGKEGKAAVAAMKELYAYTRPDLSIMKRTLARRGVDGVDSKEMLRSFSRAGMADAFYMARLKYADQAVDHLQELRREDGPGQGGDHSVLAHMIKLHSASLQKVDTPIQSALANASYITMLGASPAFLTINAMQPWMITLPVMGGRHGTLKTAKALQSAYPDAMGLFKALWGDQGWRFSIDMDSAAAKKAFAGKDGERLMIKHLLERGIIDIGIENDLRAVSEGQEAGTNKYVKAFTAPAQYVETINRVTTALAAYRLEMAETKGDDTKSRAYAEKMTADTQLDYSAANAPYIMRPGVIPGGRLLFQFRKYQQGMLALLIKQLGTAMKGETPEARKQAKNALFGLLATHMTMTGLAGLPIAFPLGVLATMIAQAWDDDDEPQPDIWWNNFLADYFGTTTAKVVNGGLPTLLGVDMQRMGLGNITSPMPYVKPKGTLKESFQETMLNLAPAEGLLTNWFAGVDSFSKGDWTKGLTQVMPKAFADPIKAMKLADDGLRTARGNPVFSAEDISGGELAMKAAGFQPSKLSTYYKAKSATEEYRLKALSVRDDLVNRWVESKGDPEQRAKVMEDIQGYRERHKGQKGVDLTFAQLHKAGVADAKFARNTTASGITATRGEQWKRDMTRFAE